MDQLNIKDWAREKDQECREMIRGYIRYGVSPEAAVEIVLRSSALGAEYKSKITHDFLSQLAD